MQRYSEPDNGHNGIGMVFNIRGGLSRWYWYPYHCVSEGMSFVLHAGYPLYGARKDRFYYWSHG